MSISENSVPDQKWANRIQDGDRAAFKSLFLSYVDPLCAYVEEYTKSPEVAEELIQDLFLKIWKDRATFSPRVSVKAYLYAAARNLALDYLKHKRVVDNWKTETRQHVSSAPKAPDESLRRKQLSNAVRQAIEELPERRKQVFKLSRQRDLTYKEIAHVLDISIKTVEKHMRQSFQFLREQLAPHESSVSHRNT